MKKIKNKLLLSFILVSFIPLLALGGYGLISITKSLKSVNTDKLNDKVTLVSSEIENFLINVTNDLFYLRDSVTMRDLVESLAALDAYQTPGIRKKLEQDFLAFSRHKKIYHQVRFLDAAGMEIVRINREYGESTIVAKDKLQDKKTRYYFADTAKLSNGQLMISPLDLNRERGKIERPLRPVIRYGTPVYDHNMQLRGIVLLNVMADKFLEIVNKKNTKRDQVLLISKKGYYFSHPDPEKEWGDETDLSTGINFKQDYPRVAEQVVGSLTANTVTHDKHLIAAAPVFLDKNKTRLLGNVVDIALTRDVFNSVTTFRNLFLLIGGTVFLATIFLAGALAKSITDPLVYLTRLTHEMSKGRLSSTVVVTTNDETKLLAESIERLRKSISILLKRAR